MKTQHLFLMMALAYMLITVSCSKQNENSSVSDYSEVLDTNDYIYSTEYNALFEEDETEDDWENESDLSANITYYCSDGGIVYINRDEFGNISGYDLDGNFISGYSDQYGNSTILDMNGNYVYSYTDGYGNTTSHDMNGNYSYSYTDSYGNTTGFDTNGNYYSAYTDDFGYTTVTTY